MIEIDGKFHEGGGQIVRTALALSTLSKKPFYAFDIRKGRGEPGLKNQHLYCVKSLAELCGAKSEGAELGSLSLKYWSGKITAKTLEIDIGTAGSITLLMQSLLMPAMFSSKPMKIIISGGTDVKWSTSFDYFSNVFLPQLRRFAGIDARLIKRGYFPKGAGKVEIKINPKFKINDFDDFDKFMQHVRENVKINIDEQGHLIQIKGISHASKTLEDARVAERQAHSAQRLLGSKFNVPIKITTEYQDTLSDGSGITLWAIFSKNKDDIDENNPIRIGFDKLGEKGKKSEVVGEECANGLISQIQSKAPVDKFLADQLLPFMPFASNSKIFVSEISSHAKTNIYTIEKFLGNRFKVEDNRISCLD